MAVSLALHREDTGMGRAWLGDLVFNMEEQVSEPENPEDGSRGNSASTLSKRDTTGTYLKVAKNVNLRGPAEDEEEGAYYSFESTPYAGGRIESIGNGIKVRKFVTDHLGSVRAIVTDNAVVERNDYYPFGGRHDNPSLTTLTSNRYGFIGKERQNISSSLDPYIDFGARFYDPLTARWLSPDPMADKYTSLTQYNYCGGDPVNFVDVWGNEVRPSSDKELAIIKNTLPKDSWAFVTLDRNGNIDKNVLKQYSGNSNNFNSLSELANSETLVTISSSDQFPYVNDQGQQGTGVLSHYPEDDFFKDTSIEIVSGLTTGETGNYGKTLFPDRQGLQNSKSKNIEIYLHPSLSETGAAEALSHEAYGHALLYLRNGFDHSGASHQPVGMKDMNRTLVNMILNARKETIQNLKK